MKNISNNWLSLQDLDEVIYREKPYKLSVAQTQRIKDSFEFLKKFSVNKVIYGINTGFGPMAQYKISDADLNSLQYNLIRSHANGAGNLLPDLYVRSVMVCRLHSLALGHSGISLAAAQQMEKYIELGIYPLMFELGSVGASGDLVQLSHIGLGLIGEGKVRFRGEILNASEVLRKCDLQPLRLELRDGLAIMNGTSCMTGISAINMTKAERLLNWTLSAGCLLSELTATFDDAFSEELNKTKGHIGQQEIAGMMRKNLFDSKLITKRDSWFFTNSEESVRHIFKKKLQEYYSIRCLPQILGPIWDAVKMAKQVTEAEINSVSDNPVVDIESENVFHGGNFHGDYISFEMDKLKMAITKLSLLAERQLNYLLNPKLNDQFPPFLNRLMPGLNFGLQGLQFTACSTAAENQALSNSMYVHSIPNNNDNQDIVSMGTNSSLLAARVIDNSFQVVTILLISLGQAVEISEQHKELSSNSIKLYNAIRKICNPIIEDRPLYKEVEELSYFIQNNDL